MYSGIRVHWGEEEEEKERGRLFSRTKNQIINPVGVRPWASALFFKEKTYRGSECWNSWTSVQISVASDYREKGEICLFFFKWKLLLVRCLWKYFFFMQDTYVAVFASCSPPPIPSKALLRHSCIWYPCLVRISPVGQETTLTDHTFLKLCHVSSFTLKF